MELWSAELPLINGKAHFNSEEGRLCLTQALLIPPFAGVSVVKGVQEQQRVPRVVLSVRTLRGTSASLLVLNKQLMQARCKLLFDEDVEFSVQCDGPLHLHESSNKIVSAAARADRTADAATAALSLAETDKWRVQLLGEVAFHPCDSCESCASTDSEEKEEEVFTSCSSSTQRRQQHQQKQPPYERKRKRPAYSEEDDEAPQLLKIKPTAHFPAKQQLETYQQKPHSNLQQPQPLQKRKRKKVECALQHQDGVRKREKQQEELQQRGKSESSEQGSRGGAAAAPLLLLSREHLQKVPSLGAQLQGKSDGVSNRTSPISSSSEWRSKKSADIFAVGDSKQPKQHQQRQERVNGALDGDGEKEQLLRPREGELQHRQHKQKTSEQQLHQQGNKQPQLQKKKQKNAQLTTESKVVRQQQQQQRPFQEKQLQSKQLQQQLVREGQRVVLPCGVSYEVLALPGKKQRQQAAGHNKSVGVQLGERVSVQYKGVLAQSLRRFDSGSIAFSVGRGEVIKGLEEGVKGMDVGERRRLLIPSSLAYGRAGAPPVIPPLADLIFDITLTSRPKYVKSKFS